MEGEQILPSARPDPRDCPMSPECPAFDVLAGACRVRAEDCALVAPDPAQQADHLRDLGFAWAMRHDGTVVINRSGSVVATLGGRGAAAFLARIRAVSPAEAQHLMARATGSYRRGNERRAGSHARNRS